MSRASAQHRSRIRRHQRERWLAMALLVMLGILIVIGFARDWSWWLRAPMMLFWLTLLTDVSAVRSRLREQQGRLANLRREGDAPDPPHRQG